MTLQKGEQAAENYLAHFGILGMKWGVRRSPEQLGRKLNSSDSTEPFTIKYTEEQSKKLVSDLRSATRTEQGKDELYFGRKDVLKTNPDIKEASKAMAPLYKEFGDRLQEALDFESTLDDDKEQTKDERKNRTRLEAAYEKPMKEYYKTRDKLVNNILGDHENDEIFSYKDFIYGKQTSFTAKEAVEGQIQEYMNGKFQHSQDFAENYLAHFGTEEFDILKTEPMSEEDLAHWGILGMKWGIRRYQNADGTLTRVGRSRRKAEGDAPTTRKRLSELTDEELNKKIARLQKEKLYKDLVSSPGNIGNPVVKKGESIAKKMLLSFGTMMVAKFAEKAGSYLGNKYAEPRQAKLDADTDDEAARLARRNARREESRQSKVDYAKEFVVKNSNLSWTERRERRKNPKEFDASVQRGWDFLKKAGYNGPF